LDIVDRNLLSMDEDGGFVLGLAGGDPDRTVPADMQAADASHPGYWRIERLSLELFGTISP
jgi:hypothetical protein